MSAHPADAVVAAAFGERVEGVLQLQGTHLLIVRYRLQEQNNLCGLNISRLENGYGVTGVSLRRSRYREPILLPPPACVASNWIGCLPGEVVHLLDGEKHLTPPVDREICDLLVEDLRRQGVECTLIQDGGLGLTSR